MNPLLIIVICFLPSVLLVLSRAWACRGDEPRVLREAREIIEREWVR